MAELGEQINIEARIENTGSSSVIPDTQQEVSHGAKVLDDIVEKPPVTITRPEQQDLSPASLPHSVIISPNEPIEMAMNLPAKPHLINILRQRFVEPIIFQATKARYAWNAFLDRVKPVTQNNEVPYFSESEKALKLTTDKKYVVNADGDRFGQEIKSLGKTSSRLNFPNGEFIIFKMIVSARDEYGRPLYNYYCSKFDDKNQEIAHIEINKSRLLEKQVPTKIPQWLRKTMSEEEQERWMRTEEETIAAGRGGMNLAYLQMKGFA